jgi:hypothetical protein
LTIPRHSSSQNVVRQYDIGGRKLINAVSKRFFVTLPDGIGEALDRWAKSEKNKPASLAAFLIEKAVREAMDQGKIPAPEEDQEGK